MEETIDVEFPSNPKPRSFQRNLAGSTVHVWATLRPHRRTFYMCKVLGFALRAYGQESFLLLALLLILKILHDPDIP